MERTTNLAEAKNIMGANFIGPEELNHVADKMGIKVPSEIPNMPYDLNELRNKQKDYILVLGSSQMGNGDLLTLKKLRDRFGINPDISEPCFYNQDWYLKEEFIEKPLAPNWILIRKDVMEKSRGKNPNEMNLKPLFPSAIQCAYIFFVFYFHSNKYLWEHDFVWCNDLDHNGDSIYVGKYIDIDGVNKNGFSIHRHLNIRKNYGMIDAL